MAASETDIVNDALGRLGISPVMALTDSTKQAQFSNRFYESTRDEVLASHPWNFASKRAVLAQLATPPDFEWSYAYQLPTDNLRLLQLNGYDLGKVRDPWHIEGNRLLTDAEKAEVRYIARVTDTTFYPALFSEALSLKLASKLCAPLTGRFDQPTALMQEYDKVTGPKARLSDVFQQRDKRRMAWVDSDLVKSRLSGGF
jgi:hypothetical protein